MTTTTESLRLASLCALNILDTAPEERFDRFIMQGQPTSSGLRRNTNSVIITPFEKFKIICVDQIRALPAPIASPGIHWSDFESLCQQSIQTGGDPNLFVRIILGCDPDTDNNDDNDPKTVGQAAKETAQAFLSGLASILRGILFPSEPDREPSKPKSLMQPGSN